MPLLIHNARILTLQGARPRRGVALRELATLDRADVLIEGDTIKSVGPGFSAAPGADSIDARGRILMPAFIDCHTHACWADPPGARLDEWEMRLRGVPYLDILARGGGIMATVRAVRAASEEELAVLLRRRLDLMLHAGTTTAEVKSGYGLTSADELKMLRAIRAAAATWAGTVVPTALIGHAIDNQQPHFVETTIKETLPAVHGEFPGIAIDAYCEKGAWSVEDCVRLFEGARALGHPVRIHADQFNSLGMVGEAVRLGAVSVDHVEATTPGDVELLGASDSAAVLLPCSPFHLGGSSADGRALVDAGAAVAVATNYNPGSAPTFSMPFAIALAVRHCGLTPAEAIAAGTVNAAAVLGLADRGAIAAGQRADLVLLRHADERMLAFELGGDPVEAVICGGRVLRHDPLR